MANTSDIVRLCVDLAEGKPTAEFSADNANEVARKAIIETNNSKDYLDYRDIRDGKCAKVFAIIEEIVTKTTLDGLTGSEFFMNLVDYRNLALGDTNEFVLEDDSDLFYVDDVARGTQGLRRQRMSGGQPITVSTKSYGVKVYEELDRILSGRASLADAIVKVGRSIAKKQYDDIYAKWIAYVTPTGAGTPYIPVAGTYSENALLELCEHVEAATGATPIITGTRAALRKLVTSVNGSTAIVSDEGKDDFYNLGYYGKFNGIPMVRMKQVHRTGTDTFMLPDNQVYVIGTTNGYKPIKYVNEGQSLIVPPAFAMNADFSEDYLIINKAGVEVVFPSKSIGVYTMSN